MSALPFLQPEDIPPCTETPNTFYEDSWVPPEPVSRYARRTSQDAAVLEVCGDCPFRLPCLEWGVRHERFGYWGGFSAAKREDMRKAWGITLTGPETVIDDRKLLSERSKAKRLQDKRMWELNQTEISRATMRAANAAKYGRA